MGKPLIYDGKKWIPIESGGGGGTTDYTELQNKPKINNVTLQGDTSLQTLGAAEFPPYPAYAVNRAYTLQLIPVSGSYRLQWVEAGTPSEDLIIIEGGTNYSEALGITWTASNIKTSSSGTGTTPTLINTSGELSYQLESDTQNPYEVARNGSVKMSGIDLSQYAAAEITWKAHVQLVNNAARRTRAALAPSLATNWYTNATEKREINMGDHSTLQDFTESFTLSLAGMSSTDLLLFGAYVAARNGYIKTEITRLVLKK